MKKHKIALIPGDGVGKEVIAQGVKVLYAASEKHGFELDFIDYPFGSGHYLKTGELVSEDSLAEIGKCDAIYLGALGDPRVKPGILEKGILLQLRFHFDQYVNLRPVKLLPNVYCPLKNKGPADIDFVVFRENTEDFYIGLGGNAKGKTHQNLELVRQMYKVKFGLDIETDAEEIAYQIGLVSRGGTERIIRYAYEYTKKSGKTKLASVDKANVLTSIYGFWRKTFEDMGAEYPGIKTESLFVDAVTMFFVMQPERFQSLVVPNMFGDIITDLGAAIQGGMGTAPSGNINPAGVSMFEPIHGSAPDIAGRGIANPIAAIWAGEMMVRSLGEGAAADSIMKALETVLAKNRIKTPDFGGASSTSDVGDAIADAVLKG
ncbi:MAG: 3-isopropylmalate dehydrogenase [Candidatus Altiarchaeales archaeon IMC4]|nr:MAG: 3-isopropylmalate dehydrogenase [Candidatus Altiarchaeales archaeon IMC4]